MLSQEDVPWSGLRLSGPCPAQTGTRGQYSCARAARRWARDARASCCSRSCALPCVTCGPSRLLVWRSWRSPLCQDSGEGVWLFPSHPSCRAFPPSKYLQLCLPPVRPQAHTAGTFLLSINPLNHTLPESVRDCQTTQLTLVPGPSGSLM